MKKIKQKNKNYLTFITPDFVYIPIHTKTVAYAPKTYVYDSTLLLIDDNGKQIYSSVSGTLIGLAHVMTSNGRTNSMVIENDFLEKKRSFKGQKRQIFKMKSDEMLDTLDLFNLNYGFLDIESLIISISYDKNYNISDRELLKEKVVELLEIVDALSTSFNIKSVIFAVNEEDDVSYDTINEYIGTYQNFLLTTTKFNYSEKDKLAKKLIGNNSKKHSVISLCDLDAIGCALKSKRLLKNKFITITGGNLKEPIVVYVKIGTCTSELLANLNIKYDISALKLIGSASEIVGKNEGIVTRDLETIVLGK